MKNAQKRGIPPFHAPMLYSYTHTKFSGDFGNRRCFTSATLHAADPLQVEIGGGGWGAGLRNTDWGRWPLILFV